MKDRTLEILGAILTSLGTLIWVLALLLLVILGGCTHRVEYIEIRPTCAAPPQPALPAVNGNELAGLPDDVYWRLEDRERRLVDWAVEMEAMLGELCTPVAPADSADPD